MRKLIIQYVLLLLAGQIFLWWLLHLSSLHIPQYIPHTPIAIEGLLLLALHLVVFIVFQKVLLKKKMESNIIELTVNSWVVAILSELVFQTIRMLTLTSATDAEKLHYMIIGLVGISLYSPSISFCIAFYLKTRKTGWLILIIVALLFVFSFIQPYITSLIEL